MTIEDFFEKYKVTADRILICHSSDFAQILGLKEPITREDAIEAFELLTGLLVLEYNPGIQYKRTQEAYDCKQYRILY